MFFIFRVDSSYDIGTGHIMRCVTLANALRKAGHECSFICKQHAGNISQFVLDNDFEVHELEVSESEDYSACSGNIEPLSHRSWLGSSVEHDAHRTNKILEKNLPDWMIVDHYGIDVSWHVMVRKNLGKIMVIDDLADRHHDCDMLLDQNLGASIDKYRKLVPSESEFCLGPTYALLRPEFYDFRELSLSNKNSGDLRRIFINFGGGDNLGLTEKVLKKLSKVTFINDVQIDVVLGPQVSSDVNLTSTIAKFDGQVNVFKNIKNMAEVMMMSDLAISAGGSTSWERCALGLPSMIFSVASNQDKMIENMVSHGIGVALTESSLSNGEFEASLETFFCRDVLKSYSKAAANVTDGGGVRMIVSKLND
tara:strand:+ start:2277 stop:3374 length:1098 start_codon:yes stop_codon:yes gene_type:complete